jgi:hypothetical protein
LRHHLFFGGKMGFEVVHAYPYDRVEKIPLHGGISGAVVDGIINQVEQFFMLVVNFFNPNRKLRQPKSIFCFPHPMAFRWVFHTPEKITGPADKTGRKGAAIQRVSYYKKMSLSIFLRRISPI